MHMYSTSTYKACMHDAEDTEAKDLWQSFVPREAMKHDFLLQAVLAFASLHIATLMDHPNEAEEVSVETIAPEEFSLKTLTEDPVTSFRGSSSFYYHKALEYQTEAFSSFRSVLDHITQENCHAALAFSIIMISMAIAFPRHSATTDIDEIAPRPTPMQTIFTIFDFLMGIKSVSAVGQEWLNAGPFGQFILGYADFWNVETQLTDSSTITAIERLHLVNENPKTPKTPILAGSVHNEAQSISMINKNAIFFLEKCFAKILEGSQSSNETPEGMWGQRGVILAWLGLVGPEFVAHISAGDSMSLLIILHWGVLLDYLNTFWWSRNSGKLLVEEIAGMLHARGEEWKGRTRWARKRVGLLDE